MTNTSAPIRLMFVVGTRPEVVKMAPLILGALARPEQFSAQVVSTGQHREMLEGMLRWFEIVPTVDLGIMRHDQGVSQVTRAALEGIDTWLAENPVDWVMVQGDTTSAFCGALAAFYHRRRVAHVEAGLRTGDKFSPFPEEMNRRLIAPLADAHFAPTALARNNLLAEGVPDSRITVTGNTGIDALLWTARKLQVRKRNPDEPRRILVTTHRRENHGAPLEEICQALIDILGLYPDVTIQFPVHLSPRVRQVVMSALSNQPRVMLSDPLDYPEFVDAMARADVILTDSGGVQEEAPSLDVPVLVLRESTERPEAVQAGLAEIVGSSRQRIVSAVRKVFDGATQGRAPVGANPFGDGMAAGRILDTLAQK